MSPPSLPVARFFPPEEAPWIERQKLASILIRSLQCLSAVSADAGDLESTVPCTAQVSSFEPLPLPLPPPPLPFKKFSAGPRTYQLMTLQVQRGPPAGGVRLFGAGRGRVLGARGARPSPGLVCLSCPSCSACFGRNRTGPLPL